MKVLICDDDKEFRDKLKKWVEEYFEKSNLPAVEIDIYTSGDSALEGDKSYDLAFLDVEMTGLSGIHTGKRLHEKNPNVIIIIVTSYMEYLDEAFKFNVFRYLSKPLDKRRLYNNMKDAIAVYTTMNTKIAIETKEELIVVRAPEIIYLEAIGKKVYVHTTKGEYQSIKKLQQWEEELNMNYFFRVHRSYIVNLEHVTKFDHDMIDLTGGDRAYLTRRRYAEFKRAYLLYLEGAKT